MQRDSGILPEYLSFPDACIIFLFICFWSLFIQSSYPFFLLSFFPLLLLLLDSFLFLSLAPKLNWFLGLKFFLFCLNLLLFPSCISLLLNNLSSLFFSLPFLSSIPYFTPSFYTIHFPCTPIFPTPAAFFLVDYTSGLQQPASSYYSIPLSHYVLCMCLRVIRHTRPGLSRLMNKLQHCVQALGTCCSF